MSQPPTPLPFVLGRSGPGTLNLADCSADMLKAAARFWCGVTESNRMRKQECAVALAAILRDETRLQAGIRSLPEAERQVLRIVRLYGALSGPLLRHEVYARGLSNKENDGQANYGRRSKPSPVFDLCDKLLLLPGRVDYNYVSSFYPNRGRAYPPVALPTTLAKFLEPAEPLPWTASAPAASPTETQRRSPAEVVLDLCVLAQELLRLKSWPTMRSGAPTKTIRNRLRKLLTPGNDELTPPAEEVLLCELLCGLGGLVIEHGHGEARRKELESQLSRPAVELAWHWLRTWQELPLWQDGLGVVPEVDRDGTKRINLPALHTARELLTWALTRVAVADNVWLDLETFLVDLWSITADEYQLFYWSDYQWKPHFALASSQARSGGSEAFHRASWLGSVGAWAANALSGTLTMIGLIERGHAGAKGVSRFCFRLTPLGRAVFRRPPARVIEQPVEPRFLTIQPNFEIVAQLDRADSQVIWPLLPLAERTAAQRGPAQTFVLTRESVCAALEAGHTLEAVAEYLTQHSQTGLPANVRQTLSEWGRQRESLVVRTQVMLGIHPPGTPNPFASAASSRPIGEAFVLLPRTAIRHFSATPVFDEERQPSQVWQLDEAGHVTTRDDASFVSLARLRQFAEPAEDGWRLTAGSVSQACKRGITLEQMQGWLDLHLSNSLPLLVRTALGNWCKPAKVFVGDVLLLQVPTAEACAALLTSRRFAELVEGQLPPNGFVIRRERKGEMQQLLLELGFLLDEACRLNRLAGVEPDGSQSTAGLAKRRKNRRG